MPSDHYHFVWLGSAGDLADDIERVSVGVELGFDVERQLHRNVVGHQPRDSVVVFGGDVDGGDVGGGIAGAIGAAAEVRAAFAAGVGGDGGDYAFVLHEIAQL